MANWRIILKKTVPFKKGAVTAQSGRVLKRYLANYVDEIGKALLKHGEFPQREQPDELEERLNLPEELKGRLYTGGFLGQAASPGRDEKNKQLGWCRRISDRWLTELNRRPKRKMDALRLVFSMGPRAVEDITLSKISTDQAMRQIWEQTVELYRQRHGWDNPDGELGWISGSHHDTDNAHMHIIMFPTNHKGTPLKAMGKALRGGFANERGNITDITAMANIAAEMFWREHLGIEYQTEEYQNEISINPTEEPPLPQIADYKNAKVLKKGDRRKKPKISMVLVAKHAVADLQIALGNQSLIQRPKRKGLRHLTSVVAATLSVKTLDFWKIIGQLRKKPEEAIKTLEENFPDETAALETLKNELKQGDRKPEQSLGGKLDNKSEFWGWSLMQLIIGMQPDPDDKIIHEKGSKFAAGFDQQLSNLETTKLKAAWDIKTKCKKNSTETKVRGQQFRNAERVLGAKLGKDSRITALLGHLIRGAERLADTLDARQNEVSAGVKKTRAGFEKRVEPREWEIQNGKMVPGDNEGPPWPIHFDAATVFEPLASGQLAKGEIHEKHERRQNNIHDSVTENQPTPDGQQESILERFVRVIRPKRERRKKMAREVTMEEPTIE